MRLSQRSIQDRIERGEPYEDDLHPDNSDNETETKQESLNMISSSSAVSPEPIAATSQTLKDTPADQQAAPVHQTITQFCRQHRLNAAFKYDADVPAARRESPKTLIERLHHRIMACLIREMQPERTLTAPPLSSAPAWITLDQVQNPVLIAYIHGDHQTTLPELIESFGYSVDPEDLNKPFAPPPLAAAHKWEEDAQWAKQFMQNTPNRFPHLVFNAISQQTYEHLAYYRRVPDAVLHPAQPEAEAILFTLANTALKLARAANFPYIGTYIVASTFIPEAAPALNFGPNQPLPTAYDLHLLNQQSEYEIMNKATTLDELQQIAYTLDKNNYTTIQSYYRVADRIRIETIVGNNKRARPNPFAPIAPTGHPISTTSSTPPLATCC